MATKTKKPQTVAQLLYTRLLLNTWSEKWNAQGGFKWRIQAHKRKPIAAEENTCTCT